jgi:hypothetical protein
MRLLIAGVAALAAIALAAPSFAQDETTPTPNPAPTAKPTAKPKAASAASCQKLKSASQRNACLKKTKVAKASTTKSTAKKAKKPTAAPAAKQPDAAQLAPTPAPSSAPGAVAVPPLPQRTI